MMFQQNDIRTPNTVLVRHKEGGIFAADKLNAKYQLYNHAKTLIIDDQYVLVGSTGIEQAGFTNGNSFY